MSAVIKRVVYGILPSLLSIMTFWLRNPLFSTRLLHMTHSLTHETGHVRLLWYSIHGLNGLTSSADIWIVQKKLRGHIINGWMDGMLVISIEGGATLLAFFFLFSEKKVRTFQVSSLLLCHLYASQSREERDLESLTFFKLRETQTHSNQIPCLSSFFFFSRLHICA